MNSTNVEIPDIAGQAQAEEEFFDKHYAEADKDQGRQGYVVPDRFVQQVLNPKDRSINGFDHAFSLLGGLEGKNLLDYGAGDGWNTICFAKAGARVWAIDISREGVELIGKKARANGVGDRVIAEARNCYDTGFPSDHFDVIYGGGILHHLDVDAAANELRRILQSRGVAVFYEPMRETRFMDIVKAVVLTVMGRKSSEVTENETPLTSARLSRLKTFFDIVNYRYFDVLSSAGLMINSTVLTRLLLRADYLLMKIVPGYRKLGRTIVIELKSPVKAGAGSRENSNLSGKTPAGPPVDGSSIGFSRWK